MKRMISLCLSVLSLAATNAHAWGNHTIPAYRAFEKMPEVAQAQPVTVTTLESFLKDQEQAIESLLASHDQWAQTHLQAYPALPAALTFKANPNMSDEARKLAFLMALRVAPNSRFTLFYQPDPAAGPVDPATLVPFNTVSTLPEQPNSIYRFVGLKPGDTVAPLSIIASASDEPDYGLDINLFADSPSDWGKVYGFGTLPFGNPSLYYATQAPFHMGFYHEAAIIYKAASFVKRTFPQLRVHQYSTLAELAFRTGHPYWGWRFSGLALHYIQDLTQPYHASLSPGSSAAKMISVNLMAMLGMTGMKDDMVILLSNRHLALEKYQNQMLFQAAQKQTFGIADYALHKIDRDTNYPGWTPLYARDVVSKESHAFGSQLTKIIVKTMPPLYVNDAKFDFGPKESGIDLKTEIRQSDPTKVAELDQAVADLLANFGSHSRNLVRGVLTASQNSDIKSARTAAPDTQ
jgi:hypothetical protein